MRICIVGAGAVGGLIGFRLAQTGHEVSLVARGEHLQAIRSKGLTLVDHGHGGARITIPLPASDDPCAFGPQDVIFIAMKAHAIAEMLPRLQPLLRADTAVVAAVNGIPWWYFIREGGSHDGTVLRSLDPDGAMFQSLDCAHVLGCVVRLAAEVRAPGEVHITVGKHFTLGEIDRTLPDPVTPRLNQIVKVMGQAGFEAKASTDIRTDVWSKLLNNISFNPLTALTGASPRQLCENEGLVNILRAQTEELKGVAREYGVELEITADSLIQPLRRPLPSEPGKTSMHQDFERGRRPEIDAILGAVIELADLVGQQVPTIRMIEALVRERARNSGIV